MTEKRASTLAQNWRSEVPLDGDPLQENSGHYGANGGGFPRSEYDDEPISGSATEAKVLKIEEGDQRMDPSSP